MNFDYTVITGKSFDETVRSVESETKSAGFRVLHVHDVAATLKEKNLTIEPYKIIEICNAKGAYTVLQENPILGLCLPCKINVYQKNGRTYISGMRPIILPQFFPQSNLGTLPTEIDTVIRGIIDNSKG